MAICASIRVNLLDSHQRVTRPLLVQLVEDTCVILGANRLHSFPRNSFASLVVSLRADNGYVCPEWRPRLIPKRRPERSPVSWVRRDVFLDNGSIFPQIEFGKARGIHVLGLSSSGRRAQAQHMGNCSAVRWRCPIHVGASVGELLF